MGRLIYWAVFALLVYGCVYMADIFDSAYINISRPPIATPRQAPYPIDVYSNASIDEYGAEETETGWTYHWDCHSPWPLNSIAEYYQQVVDNPPLRGPQNKLIFKWPPKNGGDNDVCIVTLKQVRPSDPTFISIVEEVNSEHGFLPKSMRVPMESMGLIFVVAGLYFLYIGRLVENLALLWRTIVLRLKLPLYHRVGSIFYDPVRVGHWEKNQKELEAQGFVRVVDCVHSLQGPKEYARILHKHGQVYCLLQFARVGRAKRAVWLEFFSLFADGSAVYTTTHRDPNFKRPKEYPLYQVPESADVKQVLTVHNQNVQNQGRQLAMVAPDKILDVLSELERTVLLNKPEERKKITLKDTGKPLPVLAPPTPPPPPLAPVEAVLAPPPPVELEQVPEVVVKPLPTPVTAGMAQFAVNKEASVLGIAAVAAAEKAEEHEALMAERAAKAAFKDEVVARIQELCPDVEVKERNELALVIVVARVENELDLETPFYMSKGSPDKRDRIITGVAMRVKQGVF